MSITIEIKHLKFIGKYGERTRKYNERHTINDLDTKLMSVIDCDDYGIYTIFFINPHTNSSEMLLEEKRFPFILNNGKYEWHVPAEEVTVGDFINTFDLSEFGTIKFEEGGLLGGGYEEYINTIAEWVLLILGNVGYFLTLKEIVKLVMPVYHKLIGRDNKVASTKDFKKMLLSRKTWTMKELEARTTLDTYIIGTMLIEAGFIYTENHYVLQRVDEENYDDSEFDEDSQIILGETSSSEGVIFDLRESIHDLNLYMTVLMFQSEKNKSEAYNIM